MGLGFDALDESEVVDTVLQALTVGTGGWLCPVNVDVLRQCMAADELRALVSNADLVLPDGMPLLWAARIQGTPFPARVSGSSLIWTLSDAAARSSRSVFLLGGNPGTAERAAAQLQERVSGLRIAGTACPPFGFEHDDEALHAIEEHVRSADPDIVFVALGFPKQELLIERLRPLLPAAWFLSCGISFSLVAGEVRRAPRWMQRAGLEWAHRLTQEPRRLFRRYVVLGLPFLAKMLRTAVRARRAAEANQATWR